MKSTLDTSSGKLVEITLAGSLGRKFGRKYRFAVRSAAEAVRALSAQLPGFEAWLVQSKDRGEGYAVFYGRENLRQEDLHNPCGGDGIKFVPMVTGSKNGGIVQIILGIVLVVVGVWTDNIGLIIQGAAMIVGGVIQMLTPVPKQGKDRGDNTPSYAFNGPVNTQAQGHPVPVLYGELIVGSAVLSGGIEVVDVYIPNTGWDGTFGGLIKHMVSSK